MKPYARLALLLAAFVVGTVVVAWWTVPVVAGVWGGVTEYSRKPWRSAALIAATAWALLLVVDALRGPLFQLAGLLGAIFGVPGSAVILLTLAFPASLAWAAAGLTSALREVIRERARGAEVARVG